MWQELRKVKKLNAEGANLRETMSAVEAQAKLEPYENPLEVPPTQDYMEMVIQYGYVVLFSAAFPIVPVLALFEIALEIRVDSWKLCKLTRRPFPDPAEDIGVWFYIIQTVSYVGAVTNTGIVVFTGNAFPGLAMENKWLVFVAIEHTLFLIKFLISVAIPDEPSVVSRGLAWSKRMEADLKGQDSGTTEEELIVPQEEGVFSLPKDIPEADTDSGKAV